VAMRMRGRRAMVAVVSGGGAKASRVAVDDGGVVVSRVTALAVQGNEG
jgi:hypothetical protein